MASDQSFFGSPRSPIGSPTAESFATPTFNTTMQPGQTMITGSPTNLLPSQGLTGKLLEHIQTLAQERDGLVAQSNEFQVQINEQQYKLEWADEVRIFVSGLADALGISDGDGAPGEEQDDDDDDQGSPGGGKSEDAEILRISRRTRRCLPSLFNLAAETASMAANGERATLFLLGRRSKSEHAASGYSIGSPTQRRGAFGSGGSGSSGVVVSGAGLTPVGGNIGLESSDLLEEGNTVWTVDQSGRMTVIALNGEEGSLFRQALSVEGPLVISKGADQQEVAENVESLLMFKLVDSMNRVQGLVQVVNAISNDPMVSGAKMFQADEVQQLVEVSPQLAVVGKLARRLNAAAEQLEYSSVKIRKYRVLADRGGEALKGDLAADILQQACRLVDAAQCFLLLAVAAPAATEDMSAEAVAAAAARKLARRPVSLHAAWPLALSENHHKLPTDRGLTGLTFTSGRDLNVEDVSNEARFDEEGDGHLVEAAGKLLERRDTTVLSLLSVPVQNPRTGEVVGILQAFGRFRGERTFDVHDGKNLRSVSSSIFAVLEASASDGTRPVPRPCIDAVSAASVANFGAHAPAISLELMGHLNHLMEALERKFTEARRLKEANANGSAAAVGAGDGESSNQLTTTTTSTTTTTAY